MLFSGAVKYLRKVTLALISASSPLVTTMPAPCCTETGSQPAKCGFGSTFSSIEWLSSSLVITLSGKKVALELEPT